MPQLRRIGEKLPWQTNLLTPYAMSKLSQLRVSVDELHECKRLPGGSVLTALAPYAMPRDVK